MDANHLITIIVTVIASSGFWTFLNNYIERKTKKRSVQDEALLGLLHDRIYALAKQYISDGSISDGEHRNLLALYSPYKTMGGNGTAEKLMKEVEKLPIEED